MKRTSSIVILALALLSLGVLLIVDRLAIANRSEREIPDLPIPTLRPGVVTLDEPQPITIEVRIDNLALVNPSIEYLDERNRWKHFGHLRDDGNGGDDVAHDRVFTSVQRVERESGESLFLRAHAMTRPQRDHIVHVSPPAELRSWPRMSINGVSFNHPPDLVSHSVEGTLVLRRSVDIDPEQGEGPYIRFSIDPNPGGLDVQDYYDGNTGPDLQDSPMSPISVGEIPSLKFVVSTGLERTIVVIVPVDDSFLRITDYGVTFDASEAFSLILNSIRF